MLDIFVCFQSMWIFYVWMNFQYESISMSRSSKKVEDFYFHENKVFKAFRSCTQFSSLSCVYKNISWILFLCVLFLDSGRDSTNNGKVATEKRGWMIYKLILMVLLWITRKEIFFLLRNKPSVIYSCYATRTFHPPTTTSLYIYEALCWALARDVFNIICHYHLLLMIYTGLSLSMSISREKSAATKLYFFFAFLAI